MNKKTICLEKNCIEPRLEGSGRCEEHTREYRRNYYLNNKDKINARSRKLYADNPELGRKRFRAWISNNEGHTYVDKNSGYVNYIGFNHPASNPSGVTRYHRIVLWDKLDGKDAKCWNYKVCGLVVSWNKKSREDKDALVVDHIDGDKANNNPFNLRPSCASCNTKYGYKPEPKPSQYQGVPCSGPDCDRQPVSNSKFGPVCNSHYNQGNLPGKTELTRLRDYSIREIDDSHKQCGGPCGSVKNNSEFYQRKNGRLSWECKRCTIERVRKNQANKSASLEGNVA